MLRDLRQAVINSDLGRDCGDAFGVPFEIMTREEILDATDGEGVTRPRFDLDPSTRKIPDTRGLAAGSTSDDSQLGRAATWGFIMAGRYDHECQTLLSLDELWSDVAGWGGTTKRSLYEIDKFYRAKNRRLARPTPTFRNGKDRQVWEKAEPRDPRVPARWHDKARGNGPSMKISPFGLRYGLLGGGDLQTGRALDEILEFSRMTHADPICAIAAYAIAGVVSDLLTDGPATARARLTLRILAAETTLAFLHRGDERFSGAWKQAFGLISDPEALWRFGSAGKSDSMTSVPLALAIWWRHSDDAEPTAAVLEAINAGGDTDTVGAMVGAMMGAASDRADWWPASWKDALADHGETARNLGTRFHAVCTLHKPPEDFDRDQLLRRLGYL